MIKRRTKASLTTAAALALAVSSVFVTAAPASATTIAIHGAQEFDSQVFWMTGHTNTFAYNGMSIAPYAGVDCGYPTLLVGARYTKAAGSASSGKTGTMSPGQTSAFKNLNLGNYRMPKGVFYLTTYVGPSGGCGDFTPTWSATLIYNVSN